MVHIHFPKLYIGLRWPYLYLTILDMQGQKSFFRILFFSRFIKPYYHFRHSCMHYRATYMFIGYQGTYINDVTQFFKFFDCLPSLLLLQLCFQNHIIAIFYLPPSPFGVLGYVIYGQPLGISHFASELFPRATHTLSLGLY